MATLASLTVNLLARTGRFTQPIQQAARTVERFDRQADRMQRTLQRVDSATSAARGRVLALAAAYTVATRQAVAYADGIMAVHKQTGLAIESTQALRYAAQQSFTDVATLEKGLRSFVRRAAEAAEGNASMAKGFDRLGVSVLDAEGKLKGTEELLLEVADGAARMRTEADASAALMLVMGDAGRRLVPFMRQGADGIRDLMDEAIHLGIIADEKVVVALSHLGAEATNTSMRIGAISRDLAYRFSPAAQVALGWANRLIDGFFDLNEEQRQQIVRWTAIVAAVLGGVAVIGVLARVLSGAIGIMRTFGTVLQLVFSPLVLYTALAIGAIALFKTAWERDWLGIRTAAVSAWEKIKPVWEVLAAGIDAAWKWLIDIAGTAWQWLTTTTWTEKVEDVKGWLTDGWTWLVDIAGTAWTWLTDTSWAEKIDDVRDWLDAAWKWTVARAGDAWSWLDEHAPAVTRTIRDLRDVITGGWDWTINKIGSAWAFIDKFVPDEVTNWAGARIAVTLEIFGDLYDAIRRGFEDGDWSGIWGIAADAWREGVKLAVTLALAAGTANALLSAITSGLGLATIGGASLGVPGMLGALSVGIVLMKAHEAGDYRAFGANLIAALAAGIGIGMFTGSPWAGALAFTVVLNFEIGTWIGDKLEQLMDSPTMREIRALAGTGPTRESELLAKPQLYGDRETYIGPAPDYTFGQRLRLWWQNTPLGRLLTRDSPIEFPVTITIEDVVGIRGVDDILDAIFVAEGGPAARVPYGATGFADAGHQFALEANQQLFDSLVDTLGLVEGTDEYYRAAAAVTVRHYWDTFARDFPELADRTFAELAPDIQAAFIKHLGQFYAPIEAHALNRNWTQNVLAGLGLTGFARGGYTGDAPVDRVVGVVHGQELVIPAPAVRQGLEGILEWLGVPGFQSGTPVMIDSGIGYAVSPGVPTNDIGFVRAQVEAALRWIEQSVSPELADMLRNSFERLLDVTDMLERELKVLWEAIDSVPEALDDALASARSFGDELDELLASEQERQDRLHRAANNVNAALSGFASGLGESQQLLARFIQTLRYDAESGFGFDTASLIQMGASVLGWLFGGQGQQERREARQFAAPDPLGMGGLLVARAEQQRLEAMIPSLERAVKNAQGFVDHMAGQWWNPSQQHRAAEALRVASEELSSAQQALAAFDFRGHLGIDASSIARAVESGLDLADTTRLGASLESTIRDALTRAWVASDEMLRLQNRFGDMLEGIVTEYMETGIVGDLGALRGVIAAIEERGEAFADVLRKLGLATEDVTGAFGGLQNIPRGFKYALERVEASTARAVPASVSPSPAVAVATRDAGVSGGVGLSGRGGVYYVVQGDVYGWEDFKRKVQQAEAEGRADGSLAQYGFTGGSG